MKHFSAPTLSVPTVLLFAGSLNFSYRRSWKQKSIQKYSLTFPQDNSPKPWSQGCKSKKSWGLISLICFLGYILRHFMTLTITDNQLHCLSLPAVKTLDRFLLVSNCESHSSFPPVYNLTNVNVSESYWNSWMFLFFRYFHLVGEIMEVVGVADLLL